MTHYGLKWQGDDSMKPLLVLLACLLVAAPTFAKNCKKGQPCGNSCISWSKVCRIGTGSSSSSSSSSRATSSSPAVSTPNSPQRAVSSTQESSQEYYVVRVDKLNVRECPSTDCKVIGSVLRGKTIYPLSYEDSWVKIHFGSGYGWVSAKHLNKSGT